MEDFETKFKIIVPQAIEHFASEVKRIHKEEPDHYLENPTVWLRIKDPMDKLVYLMNDEYWVRDWANFLVSMLIHEIYREPDFEFKLN